MRVAVTGGAGKLGRQVVSSLSANGHDVLSIDCVPAGGAVIADLRDRDDVGRCLLGVDGVVHLAAWPTPFSADIREVFADNVAMASNVFFTASELGIRKVVVASSQSVLGLAWSEGVVEPDYLPVDESHACRPGDGYSLSKLVTEQLAQMLSSQGGLDAKVLRFPVIWDPSRFDQEIAGRVERPQQGAKSQWAYVDVRDAARAVRQALELDRPGYELFNITSSTAFASEQSAALVSRWYPQLAARSRLPEGNAACFDWRAARDGLGFVPRYRWSQGGIEDLGVQP